MGFWSRILSKHDRNPLKALEARLKAERAETDQLRAQRANAIQSVQSGARAIETMSHMLKMVDR